MADLVQSGKVRFLGLSKGSARDDPTSASGASDCGISN
jgi:hypothetical protein